MMKFGSPPQRLISNSVSFRAHPVRWARPHFKSDVDHYWRVRVFGDHASMCSYVNWRLGICEDDYGARCLPFFRMLSTGRVYPKLGEIIFCRESFMPEVIAHEAVHAAAATVRVIAGDEAVSLGEENGAKEECLAYVVGSLVREIVDKCPD